MNGESIDIKQERLQKMRGLFPELFAEGQLDWEKLKAAFGEDINFANERYVLNWAGKSDAFKILQQPTTATLKPVPEESYLTPGPSPEVEGSGWDDFIGNPTQNVFIEGENMEVLKVLQKAYYGKVKCIIIDPPYNTGSDSFIYPDKFSEKKEDYLKRIGDKDEEGYLMKEGLFRKNSKDSGHYHSNWLSMMYPRLFLAKNLLRDDGVIFVHIDDNEVHNLRMVMNEIFGEENFVCQFIWKSRLSEDNRNISGASIDHEYILCFQKANAKLFGTDKDLNKFSNPDNDPRGPWRSADLTGLLTKDQRPNCHYDLVNSTTEIVYKCPPKGWRFEPKTMAKKVKEKRILWPDLPEGRPRHKLFMNEMATLKKNISSLITSVSTLDGSKEIADLFGPGIFPFPKPYKLAKLLCDQVIDKNEIVLDFFSGSGPTAQAILELNKEDGGNRKFILVQMPEPCDEESEAYNAGYKTIADIGKERIRRVIKRLTPGPSPVREGSYKETLFKGANPALFENAGNLRKAQTEAEERLWQLLRSKNINNCKFRRQHPIGQFIADFYCHESKLIVEVDGGYHNEAEQKQYDAARTQIINEFGVRVIRFTNEEILNDLPEVLKKISEALSPPSPQGEGRGEAGFKVFKLSPSSFKIWRGSEIGSEEELVQQLDAFTNPVKPGAEKQNMLYELMLKAGYELTSPLTPLHLERGTRGEVYSINNNELIIALDAMSEKLVEQIIAAKPQKVITLDSLFTGNDQLKTNTVLQMRDAGINFKTI